MLAALRGGIKARLAPKYHIIGCRIRTKTAKLQPMNDPAGEPLPPLEASFRRLSRYTDEIRYLLKTLGPTDALLP